MTPLNAVQQRILKLLEMPPDIYDGIVSRFSKTDFHSRETVSQNSSCFGNSTDSFTDSLKKASPSSVLTLVGRVWSSNPAYQANAFLAKS